MYTGSVQEIQFVKFGQARLTEYQASPKLSFLGLVEAYLKQKFASALHVGELCRHSRENAEEIFCIRGQIRSLWGRGSKDV